MRPEHNLNLIGLAMHNGQPVVQNAAECGFTAPEKQAPVYYGFRFTDCPRENAAEILEIFNRSYHDATGLVALAWAVGTSLKAFTGFYPHLNLHGEKCGGKTTLSQQIGAIFPLRRLPGYDPMSEYQLRRMIYGASFGIAIDEMGLWGKDSMERLKTALHTGYRYDHYSIQGIEYTKASPLALVTQDPLPFARNKIISLEMRSENNAAPLEYNEVPIFPVKDWLNFLASITQEQFKSFFDRALQNICFSSIKLNPTDGHAAIIRNHAMQVTAWVLLAEFSEYDDALAQEKFGDWMTSSMRTAVQEAA